MIYSVCLIIRERLAAMAEIKNSREIERALKQSELLFHKVLDYLCVCGLLTQYRFASVREELL